MKKALLVAIALILAIPGVSLGEDDTVDNFPELTQADMNCVWKESRVSKTEGFNTFKTINMFVGQTATEVIEIRNKTDETLEYTLKAELLDCGNREAWQDGDKDALRLETDKISIKPKSSGIVKATLRVMKNHSGVALFSIIIRPSKGKQEVLTATVCQFDTRDEINTTKPPAMFKTLQEALKNKTKIGRIARTDDFTYVVYGNIHLFCFDAGNGGFVWHFNNGRSIVDLCLADLFIFTQNSGLIDARTGKVVEKKMPSSDHIRGNFDIQGFRFLHSGMAGFCLTYFGGCWSHSSCMFKFIQENTVHWESRFSRVFGFYLTPANPDLVMMTSMGMEVGLDNVEVYELLTGELVGDVEFITFRIFDSGKTILGYTDYSNDLSVFDLANKKSIIENNSTMLAKRTGNKIFYSNMNSCGLFDLGKGRISWKIDASGHPLSLPELDGSGRYIYIFDENSVWVRNAVGKPVMETKGRYLRLFKINADTGKQVWGTRLMSMPEDVVTFAQKWKPASYGEISFAGDKVQVKIDKYTFKVYASDGRFVK